MKKTLVLLLIMVVSSGIASGKSKKDNNSIPPDVQNQPSPKNENKSRETIDFGVGIANINSLSLNMTGGDVLRAVSSVNGIVMTISSRESWFLNLIYFPRNGLIKSDNSTYSWGDVSNSYSQFSYEAFDIELAYHVQLINFIKPMFLVGFPSVFLNGDKHNRLILDFTFYYGYGVVVNLGKALSLYAKQTYLNGQFSKATYYDSEIRLPSPYSFNYSDVSLAISYNFTPPDTIQNLFFGK